MGLLPTWRPGVPMAPLVVIAALVLAVLSACSDDPEGEAAAAEVPRLDLETLEAEVPGGTLEVEEHAGAFVGAVTDDVFIGVAFPEGVGPDARVAVYLCDDEHGEWFSETLDGGTLTLDGEEVTVRLELAGDGVAGTVTWRGEALGDFLATEATGDAGLYSGGATLGEVDHSAAWVVLPDGRQRGYLGTCPPMPLHICWTQQR